MFVEREQRPSNEERLLRWPIVYVVFVVAGLPFFSFVAVIAISFVNNYEQAVSTHCKVPNYLPTISAAISLSPQKYIWRIGIALHTVPRLIGAMYIYDVYSRIPSTNSWYPWLCRASEIFHSVEVLCLLGLTMVSSREYKLVHENFFITFMVTSMFNMLTSNIQYYLSKRKSWSEFSAEERQQQKVFLGLFLFNVATFFISIYFFFRHNIYCEPGIYTLYAFFEYFVVVSNIGFHSLEILQFKNKDLVAGFSTSLAKAD
ncbi:acyltransferase PGAP2-like [Glandiceps talaboti]